MSKLNKIATGAVCSVALIIGLVVSNGNVRTSKAGLELIGNAESCRIEPYLCPANVWTDGIGNTHGVKPGVRKTIEQIAADWERNILDAEQCVNRNANGQHLRQGAFDSSVSLVFRVGCSTAQKSTLFYMLRQGRVDDACEQFTRWVWAAGKILPGLVTRAGKERALCLAK
ncbi:lysozyme [Serratia oryzae]|uniref:lysozyme n=1 Tax=Serratia oryzae TaxID=2034155 RepID=UPI0012E18EDD|nr:lysozyme [Serratia oryzae]